MIRPILGPLRLHQVPLLRGVVTTAVEGGRWRWVGECAANLHWTRRVHVPVSQSSAVEPRTAAVRTPMGQKLAKLCISLVCV